MVKVTIELVPFGIGREETLHTIVISNNCSSRERPEKGNYDMRINGVKHENIVKNFNREDGALKLLHECLGEIVK